VTMAEIDAVLRREFEPLFGPPARVQAAADSAGVCVPDTTH
jgi:hypothetical protein